MIRSFPKVVVSFDYRGPRVTLQTALENDIMPTIRAAAGVLGGSFGERIKLFQVRGTDRWEIYPKITHDEQVRVFGTDDQDNLVAFRDAVGLRLVSVMSAVPGTSDVRIVR